MAASMLTVLPKNKLLNPNLIKSALLITAKRNIKKVFIYKYPKWEKTKIYTESVFPSYEETLKELNAGDPELDEQINIGFSSKHPALIKNNQRIAAVNKLKADKDLERSARNKELIIPLDEVESDWFKEQGPSDVRTLAEHYGIFKDLFGAAYFTPVHQLNVAYDVDDTTVSPVYHGNKLPAEETSQSPYVTYESPDDGLWTLVMSSPDEHLQENNKEYLHWMIGNIPGSDVSKGQVLCDYMQPIPPRGSGFHRYIFILYKQDKEINFSKETRSENCCSLKERTFSTYEFYREHQDHITPAGLSFYLSDWDHSVQDTFSNTLGMREPVFDYHYPQEYYHPQRKHPKKEPFNKYLDAHRDQKEIAEEMLKKRLKMINPFEDLPERPKYPNIFHIPADVPTWKKDEIHQERLRFGKFKHLP